jgi:hypothetical protein
VIAGTDEAGRAVDTRQVGLVVVAILGLAVAALFVPAPAGGDGSGPGNGSDGTDGTHDAPSDGPGGWLLWLVDLIDIDATPPDRAETDEPRCVVAFDPPPEPGRTVTVSVVLDGERAADVPVWFEGERIGRTDGDGTVSGEVPYVRELAVRVGVEGGPDCVAETAATGARQSRQAGGPDGSGTTGDATAALALDRAAAVVPLDRAAAVVPIGRAAARDDNASVDVDVDGELQVVVEGHARPGAAVRVRALFGDRPVPDAEVSVDGAVVGTTDADGTATVTVPDDGRRELEVAVARGEYDASTVVDVLLLDVDLEPHSTLAVVPGAAATANATLGDRPADDAVVSVAGRERGRTDETGQLGVVLPADPRATVRVETDEQTATTSVLDLYAVPAAALGLLAALVVGLTARRRGSHSAGRAAAAIGALLAALLTIVVVDAHYGATARNAVVVAGCVLVVVVVLGRRRTAVGGAATGARRGLGRVAARVRALAATVRDVPLAARVAGVRERLLAAALRVATLVGAAVKRLRKGVARLRAVSVSLGRVRSVVADRLRRLAAGVSLQRAVALLVGTLAVAAAILAGYAAAGRPGVLAIGAASVVLVGVVLWLRRRPEAGGEHSPGDAAGDATAGTGVRVPDSRGRRSFREVWRAFARLVVPGRWRTTTPGEVARVAVKRGYPRRPVEELTALFREVEYGGRPLSAAVRDRAGTAYDSIRDAAGEGEDS